MKIFTCCSCGHTLYFNNVQCNRCGHTLGFLPDRLTLAALDAAGNDTWQPSGGSGFYRQCANYSGAGVCNWMLPASDPEAFCIACRLNRTIPDLAVVDNRRLWQRLEAEKRRLVYSLLRLELPLKSKQQDEAYGLAFDFLADDPASAFIETRRVSTGHQAGLVTLNIAEADDAVRERMRQQMAEPYRTLLGHFRHESGHYYWDRLVRDSDWLNEYRELFGDERQDYSKTMQAYYQKGAPGDWQSRFVSTYASSHPWEDWAETWAHYLHIVDTLETARVFGLRVRPRTEESEELSADVDFSPYKCNDFEPLIEQWLPITYALNSLNQSMGQPNLYPFVLAPPALEKLSFVHRVVRKAGQT
ncbi:MAG: putative zinc-binding peptidase [Oceanospirillaceae bacterium]|nr:putative zinc-binding peptidase [Oceanospirillaceae bacterium]